MTTPPSHQSQSDADPTVTGHSGNVSVEDDPREFAVATGSLFLKVGAILLTLSCGLGLFGAAWMDGPPPPLGASSVSTRPFDADNLPATLYKMSVAVALVGSMGMIAAGWALQGEVRRAGETGLAVTGLMGLTFATFGVVLLIMTRAWLMGIIELLLAGGGAVLFALAAHSASVLRRYPQPKDRNTLAQEAIQAADLRRQERIKTKGG